MKYKILPKPHELRRLATDLQSKADELSQIFSTINDQILQINVQTVENLLPSFTDDIQSCQESIVIASSKLSQISESLQNSANNLVTADRAEHVAIARDSDSNSLRNWWHSILREHGKYSIFGIFLVLPGDAETIRYLVDSEEIHLVSGKNCLIIGLGNKQVQPAFSVEAWKQVIQEQVSEGHSLTVAKIFGINISDFPCLLLFEDIRKSHYIQVSLKGMTANEISEKLRIIFTSVDNAVTAKNKPLLALQVLRIGDKFRKNGNVIISELRKLAGISLESAIESIISATVKSIIK